MDFLTWKFLHIVTMFFAVALAVSGELVVRRVAASRDPRAIAVTTGQVKPLGSLAGGLFVVGLVFGVLAAIAGQIDLLRPWLISAYVAFAAAMAVGLTITDPWLNRLQAAAAASPQGRPLGGAAGGHRRPPGPGRHGPADGPRRRPGVHHGREAVRLAAPRREP